MRSGKHAKEEPGIKPLGKSTRGPVPLPEETEVLKEFERHFYSEHHSGLRESRWPGSAASPGSIPGDLQHRARARIDNPGRRLPRLRSRAISTAQPRARIL